MEFKSSIAIVRTRKDSIIGCHSIVTRNYTKFKPKQFDYKNSYRCDEFDILETVGGNVVIKTRTRLKHSKVEVLNELTFENVTGIEMFTYHEV